MIKISNLLTFWSERNEPPRTRFLRYITRQPSHLPAIAKRDTCFFPASFPILRLGLMFEYTKLGNPYDP